MQQNSATINLWRKHNEWYSGELHVPQKIVQPFKTVHFHAWKIATNSLKVLQKKNRKVFWFWATLSILLLEKIIHHKAILENAI